MAKSRAAETTEEKMQRNVKNKELMQQSKAKEMHEFKNAISILISIIDQ